jgi:hypothetical protein
VHVDKSNLRVMLSYLFEEFFGGARGRDHVKEVATLLEGSSQRFARDEIPMSDNDGDKHHYTSPYLTYHAPTNWLKTLNYTRCFGKKQDKMCQALIMKSSILHYTVHATA